MKHLLRLAFLCLSALSVHAQCTPSLTAFDSAYWLAQPPALRTAFSSPNPTLAQQQSRSVQAATLATQGYIIDAPIMVYGWDPCQAMAVRQQLGLAWVPSALQASLGSAGGIAAPGLTPQPGQTAYDPTKPPTGSIKVSTNAADYPPFDPPAPAVPTPTLSSYVGAQNVGCIYYSLPGDQAQDGALVKKGNQIFTKHKVQTPFGTSSYYTLNGCN